MKKRAPGCLGYIGDEILPSYILWGLFHKSFYKDPVFKQLEFHGKQGLLFTVAQVFSSTRFLFSSFLVKFLLESNFAAERLGTTWRGFGRSGTRLQLLADRFVGWETFGIFIPSKQKLPRKDHCLLSFLVGSNRFLSPFSVQKRGIISFSCKPFGTNMCRRSSYLGFPNT